MRSLGLRYERLLFLAAPLAFASLMVWLVALGTDQQQSVIDRKCFEAAALAIERNLDQLNQAWDEERLRIDSRSGGGGGAYTLKVKFVWIDALSSNRVCYKIVDSFESSEYYGSPLHVAEVLRKRASSVPKQPLNLYGVELPDKASLNILGTAMKVDLVTLTFALQICLAPLLLLWMGSLYNTRHREALFIAKMSDVRTLFPHIVNIYPVGSMPRRVKKSWFGYYFDEAFLRVGYPMVRMCLVSIFVLPPVIFYVLSLYYMGGDIYSWFFGIVVSLFGLVNLLGEWALWHANKRFISHSADVLRR